MRDNCRSHAVTLLCMCALVVLGARRVVASEQSVQVTPKWGTETFLTPEHPSFPVSVYIDSCEFASLVITSPARHLHIALANGWDGCGYDYETYSVGDEQSKAFSYGVLPSVVNGDTIGESTVINLGHPLTQQWQLTLSADSTISGLIPVVVQAYFENDVSALLLGGDRQYYIGDTVTIGAMIIDSTCTFEAYGPTS